MARETVWQESHKGYEDQEVEKGDAEAQENGDASSAVAKEARVSGSDSAERKNVYIAVKEIGWRAMASWLIAAFRPVQTPRVCVGAICGITKIL